MFENLTDRLGQSLKGLAGQGQLTEDNIRDTLREVRKALLEADVALPVVKEFVEQVKEKALGQEVLKSLNPGQAFVKIVNDELVHTMGDANDALPSGTREEEGDGGVRRRLPPGGHRPAADPGRRGEGGVFPFHR